MKDVARGIFVGRVGEDTPDIVTGEVCLLEEVDTACAVASVNEVGGGYCVAFFDKPFGETATAARGFPYRFWQL